MSPGEKTWPYYREYALDNTDNFLEPYLISYGVGAKLHEDPNETLGLTVEETRQVLYHYLITSGRFNSDELAVHCYTESEGYDVVSIMKDQIRNGNPVIYSGKRYANATTSTPDEGQEKELI